MYFGGVPKEILFDNMSTVVDRKRSSFSNVNINKAFKYFSLDSGFKVVTCRPYRPQTKGKVESLAKLVGRLKVYNEEFETFEDLEKIVSEFGDEINQEISQATNEKPYDRFIMEKEYLNPLPSMHALLSYFDKEKEYKVSKESMVTYKGQKYSVSTFYIGSYVTISEIDGNVKIYRDCDTIATHKKSDKLLNYRKEDAIQILQSDALKHCSYNEIDKFVEDNLRKMDLLIN